MQMQSSRAPEIIVFAGSNWTKIQYVQNLHKLNITECIGYRRVVY
jgi:hypothetical protein